MMKNIIKVPAVTALLLLFMFSFSVADNQAVPVTNNSSIQSQIDTINAQIKAINDELTGLYAQRDVLKDQISSLRTQKHIASLNKREQDLNIKLLDAQKSNNAAKIADLNGKISQLTQELTLQQDIILLYTQLSDDHKNLQKDKAKDIESQIKAKRDAIKALYPPKPVSTVTAQNTPVPAATVGPVPTPKPEDPDIQALLDQIKPIDDQINQDKQKIDGLKKQRDALKLQLKAGGVKK